MKAVLYHRTATLGAPEQTLSHLRRRAAYFGLDLAAEYCDDQVSGLQPFSERCAGERLLRDLPEHCAEGVRYLVVQDPARLSRDPRQLRALLAHFAAQGLVVRELGALQEVRISPLLERLTEAR